MSKNLFKFNNLSKLFLTLAVLVTTLTPCLAKENVISSVIISKSKSNPGAYELNIDSSEVVPYKINHEDNGSIYFDLKNSVLEADVGTIYDDVADIDNVTVRQLDRNKVRIYIKGAHATNTELVFINSLFDPANQPKKKVMINPPIKQYQSATATADLEDEIDVQDWDDNSFNLSHLNTTLLSNLKDSPVGFALILLSFITILTMLIKLIKSKIKQDSEPLFTISNKNSINETIQSDAMKQLNKYIEDESNLQPVRDRNETLKYAQMELAKAHQKYQEYLKNKAQNNTKTNAPKINNVQRGIALNEYQKSTKNPYIDQEVIKIKKEFKNVTKPKQNSYQIPPRQKQPQRQDYTTQYIQRPIDKINYKVTTKPKKTNMNFLESVSKIYEQSGRGDLAVELKHSISKAKQSI